jgi:hypothetical protein
VTRCRLGRARFPSQALEMNRVWFTDRSASAQPAEEGQVDQAQDTRGQ